MLNHSRIGTGHLLAGLAAEGDGAAARALLGLGLDAKRIAAVLEETHPRGDHPVHGLLPFTPAAERACGDRARDEAFRRRDPFIGTEHLLLAVTAEGAACPPSALTLMLAACGVTPAAVREQVLRLLRGYEEAERRQAPEPAPAPDPLADGLAKLTVLVEAIARFLGIPADELPGPDQGGT